MISLVKNATVTLIILIFTSIMMFVVNQRAKRGLVPKIRKIPALEAIEEAVGRAAEMGRPVYFPIGAADVGGAYTGGHLTALSMIHYTGTIAAKMGTKQLVGTISSELIPMIDEVMRSAYAEGGSPELYSFEDIRWFPSQMAYIAGTAGIYAREPAGAQIMIGSWMAEALAFCEIASRSGAFMIGGTDYRPYMPYLIATCDYALIGEEIFVASAYVTDDPQQKSTILTQDILKWIIISLTIIAAIIYTAGITDIINWLKI
jgi:hypothetical protein